MKKRIQGGLASVRPSRKESVTAPQEVLDKHLQKPSEAELNEMLDSLYAGKHDVWEKVPGAYAQAVGTWRYNFYAKRRKARSKPN